MDDLISFQDLTGHPSQTPHALLHFFALNTRELDFFYFNSFVNVRKLLCNEHISM